MVTGESDARMHRVAFVNVSEVFVRPDLVETTHEMLGSGDIFGIFQRLNREIDHCFSYVSNIIKN